MSHNQYSAYSKENELIENLLLQLEKKDSELIEAFEEQESFTKIREIEIQYQALAKQIIALTDELNLGLKVKEFHIE